MPGDSEALRVSAGRYSDRGITVDSASLPVSLERALAHRPEDRRVVFVYADTGRLNSDLAWIVPVIERSGGRPYAGIVCTYTAH